MEKIKNLTWSGTKTHYCHHYWYPVWTVPSNWILPLCCNTVWILQYLLKIHHSTDDPCLCNHGNR